LSPFLSQEWFDDWSVGSKAVWQDVVTLGKCYNYALKKDNLPWSVDIQISCGLEFNPTYDEIYVSFFGKL
jgi:hypothetical protein